MKILASALTIGSGGSVREGPIVQVGASLGSTIASWMRMPVSRVVLLPPALMAASRQPFMRPWRARLPLEVILVEFTAETFGLAVLRRDSPSWRLLQGDEIRARRRQPSLQVHVDMWWWPLESLLRLQASLGRLPPRTPLTAGRTHAYLSGRPGWLAPGRCGFPMYGSGHLLEEEAIAATTDRLPLRSWWCAVHVLHYRHRGGSACSPRRCLSARWRRQAGDVACDKFASRRLRVYKYRGVARAPMTRKHHCDKSSHTPQLAHENESHPLCLVVTVGR